MTSIPSSEVLSAGTIVPSVVATSESVPTLRATSASRLVGIDAMRVVGMAAVVFIHSLSDNHFAFGSSETALLDQASRWAVPFFFIASGFFLGRQEASGRASFVGPVLRLAPIFLVWSLVYAAVSRQGLGQLRDPEALYRWIAAGGAGWHLWFLPSLALCLTVTLAIWRAGLGLPSMLGIAAGVYVLGLVLGSYHFWFSGQPVDRLALESRIAVLDGHGGPFPLIFVVIGFGLALRNIAVPLWAAVALFVAGGVLHVSEGLALDHHGWSPLISNEMLVGTVAFGTGAFLIAERLPETRMVRTLARFGAYTLGIYVSHVLVLTALRKLLRPEGFAEGLGLTAIVFLASLGLVLALTRVSPFRSVLT